VEAERIDVEQQELRGDDELVRVVPEGRRYLRFPVLPALAGEEDSRTL